MDQCLKAQICRTERWIRRATDRAPSGDPGTLGAPFRLLVAYQTKSTYIQINNGTEEQRRDLIIAEEELCDDDRVYSSLADANADQYLHILRETRSYPDLSCTGSVNGIDHYEASF